MPSDHRKRWLRAAVPWGVLVALVAGCASAGEMSAESRAEEIAVQAAAIRWLVENNDSQLGSSARAYCVGVGTGIVAGEPPVALMRALLETQPRVQPVSSCRWARDAVVGRRVVDELSEQPALAVFVDPPEWEDADTARIWAEYLERPGMGRGYDCLLARGDAGWEVRDCSRGFPRP